jgi:hypothetical protein
MLSRNTDGLIAEGTPEKHASQQVQRTGNTKDHRTEVEVAMIPASSAPRTKDVRVIMREAIAVRPSQSLGVWR